MKIIADLQLHSPYARAVSKNITLEGMAQWASKKGINLITPGDLTHPVWLRQIKDKLLEVGSGVYGLKACVNGLKSENKVKFLLVTEVSCVFYQDGKYHGIHILIFVPSFQVLEKINAKLKSLGQNLLSDGRPMLNLSCRDLAAAVLEVDERCLIIPAHSWTPWFGFYGAHGGFDSLDDGFADYSKYIYAIETGLGSDPAMNWRIKELDNRNIVSFSDAHSLPKIGREATVFEVEKLSYEMICAAIIAEPVAPSSLPMSSVDKLPAVARRDSLQSRHPQIAYTIEFYRQEGKYHYTGHRKCGVSFSPEETLKVGVTCPVCGKKLTVGAAQRTEDLAGRKEAVEYKMDTNSVRWASPKNGTRPPFVNLVPLQEILSEVFKVGKASKKVQTEYERLVNGLAPEFDILLNTSLDEIEKFGGERLREGVGKVREGSIFVKPGYDGVFGTVSIWQQEDTEEVAKPRQEGLF